MKARRLRPLRLLFWGSYLIKCGPSRRRPDPSRDHILGPKVSYLAVFVLDGYTAENREIHDNPFSENCSDLHPANKCWHILSSHIPAIPSSEGAALLFKRHILYTATPVGTMEEIFPARGLTRQEVVCRQNSSEMLQKY